ncbi:MAG: hypothetical protein IPK96_13575 [Flammeovirgaceae bacterium]|nr:hypothetical protein [Flammeovirgaceae bacterium]
MKNSKNTLTLTLIVSSIILLMALQIFWITNPYEKAYFNTWVPFEIKHSSFVPTPVHVGKGMVRLCLDHQAMS